jgi:hypothetical protein
LKTPGEADRKMKYKTIFVFFITLLLTTGFIVGGLRIKTEDTKPNIKPLTVDENDADLPIWNIGDSWTYRVTMNGGIEDFVDLNNLQITNLEFTVEQVQTEFYKLDMSGDASGSVVIDLDIIPLSGQLQDTSFSGDVFVNKSTICLHEIQNLDFSGYVKPPILPRIPFSITGIMNATFGSVTTFDFPINRDETWFIDEIALGFNFDINLLPDPAVETIYIQYHDATCTEWDEVTTGGTDYDALKVSSETLGESHSYWYSPAAGNVVKVTGRDVPFSWGYYGIYDIDIELLSTTYDAGSSTPNTPSTPTGPTTVNAGDTATYESTGDDPDGDKIKYIFNWGDGTTTKTDFMSSGETAYVDKKWTSGGTHDVKVKIRDKFGKESSWSDPLTVTVLNDPPTKPATPDGPTNGKIEESYTYRTSSTDPDGHKIKYGWDWDGNGNVDGWTQLYNSGVEISTSHTWYTKGDYNIKVKARDEYGEDSEWSDPLPVSMPKYKLLNRPFFSRLAEKIEIIYEILEWLSNRPIFN